MTTPAGTGREQLTEVERPVEVVVVAAAATPAVLAGPAAASTGPDVARSMA